METDLQWLGTAVFWGSMIGAGVLLVLIGSAWRSLRSQQAKPAETSTDFEAAMVRAIRRMEGVQHD